MPPRAKLRARKKLTFEINTASHPGYAGAYEAPQHLELEAQAQGPLKQAGAIRLSSHEAEVCIVGLSDRGAELHTVEDIEHIDREFESDLLVDNGVFGKCEVKVVNS